MFDSIVVKVLFTDQHGHNVQHNPGTLQHGEYKKK